MGLGNERAIADRFAAYIGELTKVIGHADREGPLRDYCSGLLAAEHGARSQFYPTPESNAVACQRSVRC
jgi:SRSO17 transposase